MEEGESEMKKGSIKSIRSIKSIKSVDPCGALCLRQFELPNHLIGNHKSRN